MPPSPTPSDTTRLSLSLLSPWNLSIGGEPIRVSSGQSRTLLALLALNAPRPVTSAAIIDALWEGDPPRLAQRLTQNLVSRLKVRLRRVGFDGLESCDGGYRLRNATTDVERFETLITVAVNAHRGGEHRRAATACKEALALCSGSPFPQMESDVFRLEATRLANMAAEARALLAVALAEAGDSAEALREAETILAADPMNQDAVKAAMTALRAQGNTHRAVQAYADFQARLAEETGLDPSGELKDLHTSLLRDEAPKPRPQASVTKGNVPRQLPPPPVHFTGRRRQAAHLTDLLTDPRATGVVCAVNGIGGVGKSALAVHVAHKVADWFPDGVLYADLHGATPGTEPLSPEEVLRRFLRSYDSDIPLNASVDEVAARFRALTSERRILVVLDDARDDTQVVPLLPGRSSAVLITSRRPMATIDAASNMHLDLLGGNDSVALLVSSTESDREDDRGSLASIARECGGLPLALCVMAARLRLDPGRSARNFASELGNSDTAEYFDDGRRRLSSILDTSLADVSQRHRDGDETVRLFRLAALHPGNDASIDALAAMSERSETETESRLSVLAGYRLVERSGLGRWRMHDVIRRFALTSSEILPAEGRRAAVDRMARFYIGTSNNAAKAHDASQGSASIIGPDYSDQAVAFSSAEEAYEWLERELEAIESVLRFLADRGGRPSDAALLCTQTYPTYSFLATRPLQLKTIVDIGLNSVRRSPQPWDYFVYSSAANWRANTGSPTEALKLLSTASERAEAAGNENFVITASLTRYAISMTEDDRSQALSDAETVRRVGSELNRPTVEAWGWIMLSRLGARNRDTENALARSEKAMEFLTRVDSLTKVNVLSNRGFRLLDAGRPAEAHGRFDECVRELDRASAQSSELYAEALWGLAEAAHAEGDFDSSDDLRAEALDLARTVGIVDDERHSKLASNPVPYPRPPEFGVE
ncbi:AfsR/SARP family transcriptional regulator [Salininema proteolyticum]|uniref:BTAD domain-containing putative transcriptional regulator n=1 Tax=Salininema proteolyticum TaxID=1607685 RepID=A0ABV8TW34_9ACTN